MDFMADDVESAMLLDYVNCSFGTFFNCSGFQLSNKHNNVMLTNLD